MSEESPSPPQPPQPPQPPPSSPPPAAAAAAPVQEEDWSTIEATTKEEQHDWDLTFTIWHMLPWMERKAMATQHGCKTIGEFEEYMGMRRAMMNDAAAASKKSTIQKPYPNEEAYLGLRPKTETKEKEDDSDDEDGDDETKKPAASLKDDTPPTENDNFYATHENDDDDDDNRNVEDDDDLRIEHGGLIITLPDELGHAIFSFLPVDQFASLALVSPLWKHLTRTELVYRTLCERIFLQQQSKRRRTLAMVHTNPKFGGSYRNMLERRPRIKAGLYVMKFAKVCACLCVCTAGLFFLSSLFLRG